MKVVLGEGKVGPLVGWSKVGVETGPLTGPLYIIQ